MSERDFSELPLTKQSSRYSSRKFPLHAMTIMFGHSRETTADYYNDGKAMDGSSHAAWQYTLSGRGCLELEGNRRDLLPGSLMILPIPGPHVYYLPESSDHWEFVFVTMAGREAVRITRMIERHLGNVIDARNMPQTTGLFYEILEKFFFGGIDNPFINSGYTYQLCMKFLEEAGGIQAPLGKYSFAELKNFLQNNLYRDISVEEMARVMDLSRSHFTRIFSREMGISPRLYLENLRLKDAMDFLFQEGVTVKETAAHCGIYDANYFCRLFKKHYGVSPGKYKEWNFTGRPDKGK
ncbi:MAG: AraC family transcriptional regulator [Treponema sp.]|jgi:AraC-like DNA-binding protein|nr:AraC family transcriptional regulator [Treponema sp.]